MSNPIFIHSLWRAGSTYIFEVFRRSPSGFWCYQEPLHEVALFSKNNPISLLDHTSALKKDQLRHPTLNKPYFYELYEVHDAWKNLLTKEMLYDTYFGIEGNEELVKYFSALIGAAKGRPVFQECRTPLRIAPLKKELGGTHITLWRNAWDQWWSYKTTDYFDTVNQLILQNRAVPEIIARLRNEISFTEFHSEDFSAEFQYFDSIRLSAEDSYLVFYTLWCLGMIEGQKHADLLLNIDALSDQDKYRQAMLEELKQFEIAELSFDDCQVAQTNYTERDAAFFRKIEDRVHGLLLLSRYDQKTIDGILKLREEFQPLLWTLPAKKVPGEILLENANRARETIIRIETRESNHSKQAQAAMVNLEARQAKLQSTLEAKDAEAQQLGAALHAKEAERQQVEAALNAKEGERQQMEAALNSKETERQQVEAALNAKEAERQRVEAALNAKEAERQQMETALNSKESERQQFESALNAKESERQQFETALNAKEAERQQFEAALNSKEAENQHLEDMLEGFRTSDSWRITLPLRKTTDLFRWIGKLPNRLTHRPASNRPIPIETASERFPAEINRAQTDSYRYQADPGNGGVEPGKHPEIQDINLDEIMEKIRAEVARNKIQMLRANDLARGKEKETSLFRFIKKVQAILSKLPLYDQINGVAGKFKTRIPRYQPQFISAADLLQYDDEEFINNAYVTILKRQPDSGGFQHYLSMLRAGSLSKTEILRKLRYSPEGKRTKVKIEG